MKTIEERFWSKVDKTPGHGPAGDCWLWTGCTLNNGYGTVGVNGKKMSAHRLAFLLQFGSLDEKLMVLHQCDVRNCVRGSHLRQGTCSDNMRDCVQKNRHHSPQKAKSYCAQGHPYDDANTYAYVYPSGLKKRQCRTCNHNYHLNREARKKKGKVAEPCRN